MSITALACYAHFTIITWLIGAHAGLHIFNFVVPAVALVVLGPNRILLISFIGLGAVFAFAASQLIFPEAAIPAIRNTPLQTVFMFMATLLTLSLILAVGYVAFALVEKTEMALEAEYARSEALLYNLLPEDIAARLKVEPDRTIADSLPQAAILFADIVDFTPRAASLPAEEVVSFLNKVFRALDELAEKHGLEKIKTIGDAYMVAAGMPNPCGDPVHRGRDGTRHAKDGCRHVGRVS
ncbi:hypothetical protein GV827_22770 [Sulfitobacter sp. JBTF-M27]|uniref:Guanylate cyclase domain-containing protein n=2 Tax=Sulfitobacter sediminilitoris TaxID=2698830 RepID=A0A6P0CKW0_9RHOB|nr:hypothetical protein [Sulfitobacter sediminilitoris]